MWTLLGLRSVVRGPWSGYCWLPCTHHTSHITQHIIYKCYIVRASSGIADSVLVFITKHLSIKIIMFVSNVVKCTCNLSKWYLQLDKFESATCSSCKLHACNLLFVVCFLCAYITWDSRLPPSMPVVRCLAGIATPTVQSSVNAQNIYMARPCILLVNVQCNARTLPNAQNTQHTTRAPVAMLPCCCMLYAACTHARAHVHCNQ
jgi:hypothetical protein